MLGRSNRLNEICHIIESMTFTNLWFQRQTPTKLSGMVIGECFWIIVQHGDQPLMSSTDSISS
eukprot:4957939-Amphidinium_carterae.1